MAVLAANAMADMPHAQKSIHSFFGGPQHREVGVTAEIGTRALTELDQDSQKQTRLSSRRNKSTEAVHASSVNTPSNADLHIDPNDESRTVDQNDTQTKNQKAEPLQGRTSSTSAVPKEKPSSPTQSSLNLLAEGIVGDSATPKESEGRIGDQARGKGYVHASDISGHRTLALDTDSRPSETRLSIDDASLQVSAQASAPQPGVKMLHLNVKSGTIGSPPAKRNTLSASTRPKRRRKRKSNIVVLKYGKDQESRDRIGNRVEQLLSLPILKNLNKTGSDLEVFNEASLAKKPISTGPPKPPHPFFLGKPQSKSPTSDQLTSKHVENTATPTRPCFPSRTGIPREKAAVSDPDKPNGFHAFGASKTLHKFPGATDPLWPPKDMMHVRCGDDQHDDWPVVADFPSRRERKAKYIAPEETIDEDVLSSFLRSLDIPRILDAVKSINPDDFQMPDKQIRLPVKHYESGQRLQQRVGRQLRGPLPSVKTSGDCSDDELSSNSPLSGKPHPAITKIFTLVETSMSAFDNSDPSNVSWAKKYAPISAADVLQTEHRRKEAYILKEWLQALTVVAVEAGSAGGVQSDAEKRMGRPKKKRKNVPKDFIVSDDDVENDLTEVSDIDDTPLSSQDTKRTVVRSTGLTSSSKQAERLTNTVVISGPNGCGKTAMVFAVAKELGFEVFEMNPGTRRAGKDILDRVGDMTRNHLVSKTNVPTAGANNDEDALRIANALVADIESGRQGTMNSFFKPKAMAPTSKPRTKLTAGPKAEPAKSKVNPRDQKQSLILFEEADILYDEDKQFWATVISLLVQSKRPIIITCNDETLIPTHLLSLHAILRLSSPPLDLAIDYALLIAANEGHALKREAVEALYKSKRCDLRACLADLEFWCQTPVGDRRGGLEWYYPRWPKGCDADEEGNTVRVVSEDTYQTGMGWMSNSQTETIRDTVLMSQVNMQEAWEGWQIHPTEICVEAQQVTHTGGRPSQPCDNLQQLVAYENIAESFSMTDISCRGCFAAGNEVLLDSSTPEMPIRARDDYVLGYGLLEGNPIQNHSTLSEEIALAIDSRSYLQLPTSTSQMLRSKILDKITKIPSQSPKLARRDLSTAFDPIAVNHHSTSTSLTTLEPSVFDRTMKIITVDVAPYVRSIAAYDSRLAEERAQLSSLMSQGGSGGKRKMRTTRSALSALEGGRRQSTRKEKYFGDGVLNTVAVERTRPPSWKRASEKEMMEASLAVDAVMSDGTNDMASPVETM